MQALSGTGGVDYAFEVVGTQKTIEQALLATHRGGTCVVVGVSPGGHAASRSIPSLFLQQRVLTGSSFGGGHQRTDVPMLIDLYMSGRYRLDELITRRLPLRRAEPRLRPDAAGRGQAQRRRRTSRRCAGSAARPPPVLLAGCGSAG